MSMVFEYRTLGLTRGRDAQLRVFKALAELGAGLYGFFLPQLGFASNEVVAITTGPDVGRLVGAFDDVVSETTDFLRPTLRPRTDASLYDDEKWQAGIYVHRWFTVDASGVDEFVSLSGEAWQSFEKNFDARIAGLFRADPTRADEAGGVVRLLLLTRYGSHGVWEESRNEAADPEAWKRFMRRHELTRQTIGRSSLLMPCA